MKLRSLRVKCWYTPTNYKKSPQIQKCRQRLLTVSDRACSPTWGERRARLRVRGTHWSWFCGSGGHAYAQRMAQPLGSSVHGVVVGTSWAIGCARSHG